MLKTIAKNIKKQFAIKKSKFLVFAYYVTNKEEIKSFINDLWKEYPDASHICYGYILDDNTYYFSDDGEPSGCAGQPIYNAIKNSGLNYCLVCVVRYFGGIKFGPGPLRQTFRDVSLDTLKEANLIDISIKDIIEVEIPLSESKKWINSLSILIIDKRFDSESVVLTLAGSKEELVSRLYNSGLKILSIKEKQIIK